jgi:chromosome segregation protein
MRLKQLELVGFKSFPTRTVLEFPPGITGVVGPNGCGKSNIVDAIRWVLGEQSAKHLRGDNMEAVVFNGNERQSPLGMAEVSLIFENIAPVREVSDLDRELSDLPAQFRDLSEVMITRRYFRSGESEYFINKVGCRLKDITELFLGTGVGSKAYAIIEQGRVSEMINAKPEERRLFIEEAAGTTLYRSRKLAAERKMERTRENLSRVTDILTEIDRQRRHIERQAKRAETHRVLSGELRDLELRVVARQVGGLTDKLEVLAARRDGLRAREIELAAVVQAGEADRAKAEAARAEAEHRLSALRESLAVLESERQNLIERAELLSGERDERARRRERLTAEIATARQSECEMGVRLAATERDRDEWVQLLAQDEAQLSDGERDLAAAQDALAGIEARIDADKNELVAHVARQAQAHNARSSLQHRSEDIARQLGRLRDEDGALEGRIAEAGRRSVAAKEILQQLRGRLAMATAEQEKLAEDVRRHAEERRRLDRQIAEFEGQLVHARSRLETLVQIQSRYEGFERGVRSIMGVGPQHPAGVLGVVADVIDIPQQYERAAAAVLGERLQYVIVAGEEDGAGAVDRLRREEQGRGSFIPLHPRQYEHGAAQMNGASKRMLELVAFDESFRSVAEALLGDVVLVPDLTTAVSAWRQDGGRVTLVTPDGDVMQPSGVITGGSDRPAEEELLARRREIEALKARAEETAVQLGVLREAHDAASLHLDEAEVAVRAVGEGAHDLAVEVVAAEKDIERIELEIPEFKSRREVLRYEVDNLTEEARSVADSLAEQQEEVSRLERRSSDLERQAVEGRRSREESAGRAETLRADVTAMKVRAAERRERKQAAVAALESLLEQRRDLASRQLNLTGDLEACVREQDRLSADIEEARRREREAQQRLDEIRSGLGAVAAEVDELAGALQERIAAATAARANLDELRRESQEVELAHSEARLRKEHLAETIREKYDCDIAAWCPAEGGPEDPAIVAHEVEQVDSLRQRLAKMGDVNPAAIDELRELEERSAYLTGQRDDLERSLTDLEKTIQKLNRASRARFAETFAQANETFQQVFPRLFRGGEGRLVLTDENNLLESGVDIIVRPPGKRLDNVNLLSGGEKALVAVSLIFSLFLINPTPFCILDEVDAPLDDANIGRFSEMVAEMSHHSQFILITHNKRTMESANVLYGVTMQEPGVSKLVSVSMA